MDKNWKRAQRIAEGYRDEWERRVEQNAELMREIQDIRTRYGFPLPDIAAYNRFIAHQDYATKVQLHKEIDDLMTTHKLPEEWRQPILGLVVLGWALGACWSMGFPRGRIILDPASGTSKDELIIDDSTDLKNPLVLEYIKLHTQSIQDTCPEPVPMKNNPKKKDWHPVLEYKKKYPNVTHEQIAKMINYSPDVVRRKLAEIDQDVDTK